MADREMVGLMARAGEERDRKLRRLLAIVVAVNLLGLVALGTVVVVQNQQIEENQSVIRKQQRKARELARLEQCNVIAHRINDRNSDRVMISLIKGALIAAADPGPEDARLREFILTIKVPSPPEPKLFNAYKRNCKGEKFYDPEILPLGKLARGRDRPRQHSR